ncbi:phytoene/squalene synthase family protein, partial [Pseudomonas agarici]
MTLTSATEISTPQSALAYQEAIFPRVSRSFALSIPALPPPLRKAMTNAYLLCRIADTIEDEPALPVVDKLHYGAEYLKTMAGDIDARQFCDELSLRLSEASSPAERDLLRQFPLILEVFHTLSTVQREAILRCLTTMCSGMAEFYRLTGPVGLATLGELERYCYYVAGVVGVMFTELLVDFDQEHAVHRERMLSLALSFGEGLQLANILKDQWEDRQVGICRLPRDLFERHGVSLLSLHPNTQPGYGPAMIELIGFAHAHLRRAMDYALLIAPRHSSLRFFCLHAIGLAILTLRNLHRRPDFQAGSQVKVSRTLATATFITLQSMSADDAGLRQLFE